ncbi:mismatch-specific DNA-glycosylase [Bosea sp. 124]|uniref:mismatch-specific DNA-glycosylase n=1 Tax=Bosea sp. 124 TaxID=2135642 RepID=UPI000D42C4D9|nr:mismatch-specific DNA-glycosylase [Bosea sp. 124]PTM39168.1 G/U mismatch-specific uracil-DNA glycosylase [Bosea sp. 124]
MVGTSPTMTLEQPVLPDILAPGLRVVFCGTQAGAVSARRGAYYAGPGNRFWKALHAVGLTPRQLAPEEFPELLRLGMGLTDVAKASSGPDSDLLPAHFDIEGFKEKMRSFAPAVIAFNGKRAAQAVLGLRDSTLPYGLWQARMEGASVFVLPSTSGAASGFWSLAPWRNLAAVLNREAPRS